jgi:hypothetical protein
MGSNLYAAYGPGNALLQLSLALLEEIVRAGHGRAEPAILQHDDLNRTGQRR